MKEALLKKRHGIPTALLLILVFVGLVSAAIYWTETQTLTQTIKEIGTVKTSTISLPNVNEGGSKTYTTTEVADFEKALKVKTSDSTQTNTLFATFSKAPTSYDAYELKVIADTVPGTSGIGVGSTVLKVDLTTTSASKVLDAAGDWMFDYEVTVTAGHIDADTSTSAEFTFELKVT